MIRWVTSFSNWCRDRWFDFRWQGDRIRVADSDGRLLSLQPGDQFVLFGEVHHVLTRSGDASDGLIRCRYGLGTGEMVVLSGTGGCEMHAELRVLGDRRAVFVEDLVRYESRAWATT